MILPIAVMRFCSFSGHHVPFGVTIFGGSIFLLSGLVNVVLFTTTRRILPLSSLNIGRWNISHPQAILTPSMQPYTDPYYQNYEPSSPSVLVNDDKERSLPALPPQQEPIHISMPTPEVQDMSGPEMTERRGSFDSVFLPYTMPDIQPVAPLQIRNKKETMPYPQYQPEEDAYDAYQSDYYQTGPSQTQDYDNRQTMDSLYSLYGRQQTDEPVPPVPPMPAAYHPSTQWSPDTDDGSRMR
ncbi:hypothetical protein HGRIS_002377 [Hohenbuehelia grisea]|uniref:Uncharacterized protein n=1 Tax=Hohenbuehelia grisea TaxID=104357 RepID=A0ABR3JKG1_9AGAR